MPKKQILLLSSSQFFGFGFLEHFRSVIEDFLGKNKVTRVLFIPYAQRDYDKYTEKVATTLSKWGVETVGIHTKNSQEDLLSTAQCIFVGGGNTFLLLKSLYEHRLIEVLHNLVLNQGIPYIGSSAGTNVATMSIRTTNDMPIVYPPSFDALKLVPFNINPHYMDADPNSKHMGETREQRLKEFHEFNDIPVLGLREGTCVLIDGSKATLVGRSNARLFQKGQLPQEVEPDSDLSYLMLIK